MLLLYKYENKKLSLDINEHNLEEFLEDIAIENRTILQTHEIQLDITCDPRLTGYFDDNLVRSVLNSAINNSQRYTRDQILLSAEDREDFIVLRVEDNGDGFPDDMLEAQAVNGTSNRIDQGSTQLGLYFANLIARIHINRDNQGFIRFENRVNLSGGCFSLWLP